MKNIQTILLCVLIPLAGFAQRNVEKTEGVSVNDKIELDFQFASDIKVLQWDKKEVQIQATVNINDGDGNDAFSLQSERFAGVVKIRSDFGDYFKNQWKDKNSTNCNTTTNIDYVVYVPKGANLKVKSISGSLYADTFSGTLETDLISGDVELKKYLGTMHLKTISGDLDVTMKKAKIDAKTLTGTIYSDLDIATENSKNRSHGHNRVRGTVNSGGDLVELETISGNIYMRKG